MGEIQAVLRGPLSDRLFAMVQKEVQTVLDTQTSVARPLRPAFEQVGELQLLLVEHLTH